MQKQRHSLCWLSSWIHATSTTHAEIKLETSSKKSSQTKHVVIHVCHLERTLCLSNSRWTNLKRYVSNSVLLKNSPLNISKGNWMRIWLGLIRRCKLFPAHMFIASRIDKNATLDRLAIRICRHCKAPSVILLLRLLLRIHICSNLPQQHRLQSLNSVTLSQTSQMVLMVMLALVVFSDNQHVYVLISRRNYSSPEIALEPVRCPRSSRCLTPSQTWIFL